MTGPCDILPPMDSTLKFAVDLARGAGELLQDRFKSSGTAASKKADSSVVTEADLAADRWITSQIQSRFPQDRIISEELHSSLESPGEATWVVEARAFASLSRNCPFEGRTVHGRVLLTIAAGNITHSEEGVLG